MIQSDIKDIEKISCDINNDRTSDSIVNQDNTNKTDDDNNVNNRNINLPNIRISDINLRYLKENCKDDVKDIDYNVLYSCYSIVELMALFSFFLSYVLIDRISDGLDGPNIPSTSPTTSNKEEKKVIPYQEDVNTQQTTN